jgi:GT2 family glycosyltransferase
MKVLISIVIPVKKINDLLRKETIPAIFSQTYQTFEIIILPDFPLAEMFPRTKIISTWPKTGPANKRDLGVVKAKGGIVAFLDDDSYPDKDWLENAFQILKDERVCGVCGPALTPPDDNLYQKVSGYVWSTWLGSGGAGTYRSNLSQRREVDDYPTVNFLVKKEDLLRIGGFNSSFWPGEDTKLCHDLVYKLGKKIIYDPKILVYHHRREVFVPHLLQISRYALYRGYFARILPKTSRRLGYFIPTLFLSGLISGPILIFTLERFSPYNIAIPLFLLYLASVFFYFIALLATAITVFLKEKNLMLSLLLIPSIFLTHIVYGFLFVRGFLSSGLKK